MNLNTLVPSGCTLTPGSGSGLVQSRAKVGSLRCSTDDAPEAVSDLVSRRFIVVDATNLMETNVALALYFWSSGSDLDHPDMYVTLGLFPGLRTRLSF